MNDDLFAEHLAQAQAAQPQGKKRMKASFSGGRSSARMVEWLKNNMADEYDIVFTFCNTSLEDTRTLDFAHRCDQEWGLNLVWLEAVINPESGAGTRHRVVTYETAKRNGEIFEDMIRKYGVPNLTFQPCNRELKLATMNSYMNSIGWKTGTYYTAIGIRADEDRRVNAKAYEEKIVYPLIDMIPCDKQDVISWWEDQPFDLEIEEHEGNCVTCFKKSDTKLLRLIKDRPEVFDFTRRMEQQYGFHGGPYYGNPPPGARPRVMFRRSRTTDDLFALAKEIEVLKARQLMFNFDLDRDAGCSESCEAYSMAA